LHLAIDRTKWGCINLFVVSLIWDKRGYPIYWSLLEKQGNSSYAEQTTILSLVLPLFKQHKVIVLGDREFCSVRLGNWLQAQRVYFCLRLRQNEYVHSEEELWLQLQELGLIPGTRLFLNAVQVTKKRGFGPFNLAAKWKRKYRGWAPEEGWFILTNLEDLESAIRSYQKRFGIEEMFRDFKSGGYDLEGTKVTDERLIGLVLLIAIAYTAATMQGRTMKRMGIQKYVGRVQEAGRVERRHSCFYIGLYGQSWMNFRMSCGAQIEELMQLSRNKVKYYRKGLRAMKLILEAF
jgi:Transposase DDE domain